jgi:hypothetical protein
MWHMARAILYGLAFAIVAFAAYWTARWLRRNVIDKPREGYNGEAWIPVVLLRVVAIAFIVFGVGGQAMTVTKIAIAPKVYIIEYVVDTIQSAQRDAELTARRNR